MKPLSPSMQIYATRLRASITAIMQDAVRWLHVEDVAGLFTGMGEGLREFSAELGRPWNEALYAEAKELGRGILADVIIDIDLAEFSAKRGPDTDA